MLNYNPYHTFAIVATFTLIVHHLAPVGGQIPPSDAGLPNPKGDRRDPFDSYMDPLSDVLPITGDMLNTTKCYCKPISAERFDPKQEAGHYYKWIYYNFHSDTWFNVSRWCRTTDRRRHKVPNKPNLHKINDCLTYWNEDQGTPSCDYDSRGNVFCTRLEWEDGDWIYYNNQKRAHTGYRRLAPASEVRRMCQELCGYVGSIQQITIKGKMEEVAGQYRADLNSYMDQHQDFMWSYIDSDYSVPDMCNKCK